MDIQIKGHHPVVVIVDVVETIMHSEYYPVVEVVVEGLSPLGVVDLLVEVVVLHLVVVEDVKINLVIS